MKEINISIFRNIFLSNDVPYTVTLQKALSRIKTGKSQPTVDLIRASKDKNVINDLKKKLPAVMFNGVFSERNIKGLVSHSGLMVVDFDKYPSHKVMMEDLEKLKENKYFVSLFISPSGKGIKGIVKIPACTPKQHSQYFKQFNDHYGYDYFDKINSDVSRVCFESYDPNIYVNYKADTYSPDLIDEGFRNQDKPPLIPLNDDDRIIEKVMDFKWSKTYQEGQRNAYIFDIAGAFCEYGIGEHKAISFIDSHIVLDDLPKSEMENTIKSAYRRRNFGSKYFEDYNKIQSISVDMKNGKDFVIQKHNINEDTYKNIKDQDEEDDFWYITKSGGYKIIPIKYKLFLERNGFKKFFPNGADKPNFVKIVSNKVVETSVEKIKDFVMNYLVDRKEFDLWNYTANYSTMFSETFLLMLDSIELMMLKDTPRESFIAFRNGIVKVSKTNVELMDYIDVDGYIWKNSIIDRDFCRDDNTDNNYKSFINNISSGTPMAIECVIGYLLSSYKNKMNNKAIILNDEVISDNPEGGTGKGLFIQGIREIKRTAILDGKSFDDKKSFPYQTVSQDTQVLVFDDVKRNFSFESKFSLVTEGITLERKNKDAIKLTVEESPKLVISTNYAIKGEGNSHDRRRHELEFSQYYNKNRTPVDEFGCQLFDEWDKDHFSKFDNYMIECLQLYLKEGLVEQNAKNLHLRKFVAETSMEFYEWMEDGDHVAHNSRNDKAQAFESFISDYSDFRRWLTKKRFNIWLKKYSNFKGFQFLEGNSNGARWFEIQSENKPKGDDLPF